MNWKFWKKHTPTSAPAPKLTDLERAILDDAAVNPEKWRHRVLNDARSVRSDKGSVTIVSTLVDSPHGTGRTAVCGAHRFGGDFADRWFKIALGHASSAAQAEREAAAGKIEAALRKTFLE